MEKEKRVVDLAMVTVKAKLAMKIELLFKDPTLYGLE
jgi:hypothetical protein